MAMGIAGLLFIAREKAFCQPKEAWVSEQVLILLSTREYGTALRFAKQSSRRLQIPLNLRKLKAHPRQGLTFSREECEQSAFSYPCYVPRGRIGEESEGKEGISIEHSSAYEGLKRNYYIVVAGVFPASSKEGIPLLERIKKEYPDAYLKPMKVYQGCLH